MTANVNPDTLIHYGYIAANSLHGDIVTELQDNGTDVYYDDAKEEAQREVARKPEVQAEACTEMDDADLDASDADTRFEFTLVHVKDNWEGSKWEQQFNDNYQPDEPIHEGTKDGVKYRTSWLGGALNVWCFFSPHVGRFRPCSPCVPGAADLDSPDPEGIEGYTVPESWRDEDRD